MTLNEQLAKQLKDLFLTGQWIGMDLNLKAQLDDVDVEMANTHYESLNTIALLSFHLNYYLEGVINVFKGGTLDIRDKYSYDMPTITSQQEWDTMRENIYRNAEYFVYLVEQMPTSQLNDAFTDEKYGTYLRNLMGILEHSYYHLGQIVLIKKLLKTK
ncbi:MAG TPA: DUF1572 domain-containing protein [Saprospiraceae bacterium]|nr:DUF1572 domain-containing protein [Saprospiraceae bacterium]